jgi:hypothetical protein
VVDVGRSFRGQEEEPDDLLRGMRTWEVYIGQLASDLNGERARSLRIGKGKTTYIDDSENEKASSGSLSSWEGTEDVVGSLDAEDQSYRTEDGELKLVQGKGIGEEACHNSQLRFEKWTRQ